MTTRPMTNVWRIRIKTRVSFIKTKLSSPYLHLFITFAMILPIAVSQWKRRGSIERNKIAYQMKNIRMMGMVLVAMMLAFSLVACNDNEPEEQPYEIDYSDTENWVKMSAIEHEADVFYLYPTAWAPTADEWLNTIDNASMRAKAPVIYGVQGSCFEGVANVFAPYYRQLNAMKLLKCPLEEQEQRMSEVPYHDAVAAFEYYLKHYNMGRPFILAGHSQGSFVLKLLLKDYMAEHPEVYSRMIAAYPLGYSYTKDYFEKYPHLKFAEGETDTQVVVTWNSERMVDGNFGSYNLVCHEGALSINPVSWKHDYTKVEADDPRNLGALNTLERYSTQVLYDAERKYEVLIVGMTEEPTNEQGIGEYALHNSDFRLFYYNIRENAKQRINRFLSSRASR